MENTASTSKESDINEISLKMKTLGDKQINHNTFINAVETIKYQKWLIMINLVIEDNFNTRVIALVDSGADHNVLREGIVPIKYLDRTNEKLYTANGESHS